MLLFWVGNSKSLKILDMYLWYLRHDFDSGSSSNLQQQAIMSGPKHVKFHSLFQIVYEHIDSTNDIM